MSVLIAMSGGVDSSVSAYLMTLKYKFLKGSTMILSGNDGKNISDSELICKSLGIEHETLNYSREFNENVIKNFVESYEKGLTPNPCITCNKLMKFGKFLKHAEETGFEKISTGHYAKIERENSGRYMLRKGEDLTRDQSYVLYMLTQNQLSRIEFPLGSMKKSEVRNMAEELKFVNSKRKDSQDICFINNGNYAEFIESYTGKNYKTGNFVDPSGKILGTHKGIIHYTEGQRRGLGVSAKTRLYISNINIKNNTITLSSGDGSELLTRKIKINDINLIAFERLPENFKAKIKIRYRQNEIPAIINQINENEIIIEFQESVRTPSQGQAGVIYDGDYVIGGGTITDLKSI